MLLRESDLENLCEIAIATALSAADVIRHFAGKKMSGESILAPFKKTGTTLASQILTQADLASDDHIRTSLAECVKKYDLAILTEEREDDRGRLEKDYFWCIDPLDGTLAFTENRPGYAVSIALVRKDGKSVIGVVCDVVSGDIFTAINGRGAYKNNKPILLDIPIQEKNEVPLSFGYDAGFAQSKNYQSVLEAVNKLALNYGYAGIRQMEPAGAVMNACNVLKNAPGVYFKIPKAEQGGGSIWDFAATNAIFNELPAWVSDAFGRELNLNPKESTFMNKSGVVYSSDPTLKADLLDLIVHY